MPITPPLENPVNRCSSPRPHAPHTYAHFPGITKLSDANDAGTRGSQDCTLILTEGDSAKSLAMSGLSVVGHDKWGVFPLRWEDGRGEGVGGWGQWGAAQGVRGSEGHSGGKRRLGMGCCMQGSC